jgi:hypothetical protein
MGAVCNKLLCWRRRSTLPLEEFYTNTPNGPNITAYQNGEPKAHKSYNCSIHCGGQQFCGAGNPGEPTFRDACVACTSYLDANQSWNCHASYICSIPYSRQHFCEAGNPGGCDSSIVRLLACDSSEKVSVGPGWHVASFSETCWRGSADISRGFAVTPSMHHSASTQTVLSLLKGVS